MNEKIKLNISILPVNDPRRVYVLHPSDYLVNQELDVVIRQLLGLDDVVEVGAHQVSHHVAKVTAQLRKVISRIVAFEKSDGVKSCKSWSEQS